MLESVNPTTGEVIGRVAEQSHAEVDSVLDAAAVAQREWRRRSVDDRAILLRRMATVLRDNREPYARAIAEEMGKPIGQARAEIDKSALTLDFYADHAPTFLAFDVIPTEASESGAAFDPLGVVLAIMPWNYPFWQFFRFAAPALAAGNGAVLKHANNVPRCAQLIAEVFEKAQGPTGLLGVLFIDSTRVADVIADDRIAAVTLTGSTEVGAIVASQAGAALKKQVLELGGSDPFIVLADADLDRASTVAVSARFTANGQSCVNAKRFLVDESVADEFVALFVEKAQALVVGDPFDDTTQIGPMARDNLRNALHDQVRRSVDAGALLKLGGAPIDGPGFFYPPTILDHVTSESAVFREETFGPVAAVTRVADVAEAIALANDSEYGLGAAVWTRDTEAAKLVASALDAGAVFVNAQVASDPRLPFGGIKKSGYGRELGMYGIREFVNVKSIWIESAR